MDAPQRVVAVHAIRDLVVTYAMAFDDHDWVRLGSLWTEDAAFVVGDQTFEGREAVMAFLSTCLPDDYDGKHMNPQTLIQLADDGQSAVADTDAVWIPQNFQNTILARYHDDVVKHGDRWLFRRREEFPVKYRPGPPPMSGTAMSVSSATMLSGRAAPCSPADPATRGHQAFGFLRDTVTTVVFQEEAKRALLADGDVLRPRPGL